MFGFELEIELGIGPGLTLDADADPDPLLHPGPVDEANSENPSEVGPTSNIQDPKFGQGPCILY
jgi:hypothetical protein